MLGIFPIDTHSSLVIDHSEIEFATYEGKRIMIGHGSSGEIYKGIWNHYSVAVKELTSDKDSLPEDVVKEFTKECIIMAGLRVPNIVTLYGYSTSPIYSMVMEYMAKGSLDSLLRIKNDKPSEPLEWPLKLRIAKDMTKGLAFLHQRNILHRDIESRNVLLDDNYVAKLCDFGLSRVKDKTKDDLCTDTYEGTSGTPPYISPELFGQRSPHCRTKSDIYALGITFWELAARKSPTLIAHLVRAGNWDGVIPVDCNKDFATLILDCCAKIPEGRPSAK